MERSSNTRLYTDNSKERVLIVHNFYQIGGGEHTVFENEKRLLEEHGHYLAVYTRNNSEIKSSFLKRVLLPITTVFSLKTYREIKKIIKTEKIEIVHCHNTFPLISPSVYYAAWKCDIPVIQTIHNFRFICANGVLFRDNMPCEDCINKSIWCGLMYKCYRNSRVQTLALLNMLFFHRLVGTYKKLYYIFLTDFNRKKFRNIIGERLNNQFIKPNFEYIDCPQTVNQRDGSYVFIGRLEKNKGIDFLVDSWDIDKDLYIFGGGSFEDRIKKESAKNHYIHYMGFRQQEEIWQYLSRATALIFPTDLYEGFPMTIIEAFSFGTPVVCSNIGNGADIVKTERAGVLFKRRNKKELMSAIKEVEENFTVLSKQAKEAFETNYTPEANYKQLKSIYEAVENG